MIMLSGVFNDKAQYLKELDFNYSIKGDIEAIGRMITANFIRNKSSHYIQEKEKRYRHLIEFLHLQNVLAELDEQLARMDEILDQMADNDIMIRDGFALLKADDISGMRDLLLVQGQNAHALNDDEIREATQELMIDKIKEQQDLQDALELELNKFEQRVNGLDHNSEEYQNYKAELDGRRSALQKIASQNELNYERAEKYLWAYSGKEFKILEKEQVSNKKNDRKIESNNLNDNDLYEQLAEDHMNDPSQKETKLLFPDHKNIGPN